MTSTEVHPYDAPGLSGHEFLLAVMHDPSVDLHLRMQAAEELCRAGLGDIPHVCTLRIVIEGGLPGEYIPTDLEAREVALLQRIYNSGQTLTSLGYFDTPGPLSPTILGGLPIKGRVN
jgi:hypothetical protein